MKSFGCIRVAPWGVTCSVVAAYGGLLVLANNVYRELPQAFEEVELATAGLVSTQLVLPLIALAVVAIPIFGFGRLRANDVGWRRSALLPAAASTVLVWTTMQFFLYLHAVAVGERPVPHRDWPEGQLAALLGQLGGTALLEETLFRGYLLPQFFLAGTRALRPWLAMVVAVLASLFLFVLSHLPRYLDEAAILEGTLTDHLLWTLGFGAILTLVFLVTRNVFVCIGLHALYNARPVLVDADWQRVNCIWWVLSALLVLVWWSQSPRRPSMNLTPSAAPPPSAS